MHQISAVENTAVIPVDPEPPRTPTPVVMPEGVKDTYYDEWDDISDPPDAGEIDAHNSDSSDFEQTYIKKKKKKAKANVNDVLVVEALLVVKECTFIKYSLVIMSIPCTRYLAINQIYLLFIYSSSPNLRHFPDIDDHP